MKDYKEKIRKLLALAESPNEFEAKAALLKAKELMAQHKIEEIDLIDVKSKKVKRIYTDYFFTKRGDFWIGTLAQIIAENYCCKSAGYVNHGSQKRQILFVGLEDDVELCSKIFEYAVETAKTLSSNYVKKEYKGCNLSIKERSDIRKSYAYGFATGVKEAFEDQKEKDESGWGLVMVVPKEVNDECSDFRTDKRPTRKTIYRDIRNDGFNEGKRFNPNGMIE